MGLLAIDAELPECALGAVEGKTRPWIPRQARRPQPDAETGRRNLCMRYGVVQAEVEGVVNPCALAFHPDTRPDRSGNTKEHQRLVHQVRSQVPEHTPTRTAVLPPGVQSRQQT